MSFGFSINHLKNINSDIYKKINEQNNKKVNQTYIVLPMFSIFEVFSMTESGTTDC